MIQVNGTTQEISGDAPIGFGRSSVTLTAGGTVTVSDSAASSFILEFTGTLPNNATAVLPLKDGARWLAYNAATSMVGGDFTVTIKGATGTGIVLAQGKRTLLYCDGTNIYAADTDAILSGAMPAGRLSKSVAGGTDVTLTLPEAANGILEFSGTLTANINVVVPTRDGSQWTIYNGTTGAYTLTVKTASGTGAAITQTKRTIVYCDGTNIVKAAAEV